MNLLVVFSLFVLACLARLPPQIDLLTVEENIRTSDVEPFATSTVTDVSFIGGSRTIEAFLQSGSLGTTCSSITGSYALSNDVGNTGFCRFIYDGGDPVNGFPEENFITPGCDCWYLHLESADNNALITINATSSANDDSIDAVYRNQLDFGFPGIHLCLPFMGDLEAFETITKVEISIAALQADVDVRGKDPCCSQSVSCWHEIEIIAPATEAPTGATAAPTDAPVAPTDAATNPVAPVAPTDASPVAPTDASPVAPTEEPVAPTEAVVAPTDNPVSPTAANSPVAPVSGTTGTQPPGAPTMPTSASMGASDLFVGQRFKVTLHCRNYANVPVSMDATEIEVSFPFDDSIAEIDESSLVCDGAADSPEIDSTANALTFTSSLGDDDSVMCMFEVTTLAAGMIDNIWADVRNMGDSVFATYHSNEAVDRSDLDVPEVTMCDDPVPSSLQVVEAPTAAPTDAPTEPPTEAPTEAPTATPEPTVAPTFPPSNDSSCPKFTPPLAVVQGAGMECDKTMAADSAFDEMFALCGEYCMDRSFCAVNDVEFDTANCMIRYDKTWSRSCNATDAYEQWAAYLTCGCQCRQCECFTL